jgi:glycosyltransferase involved in cell wall biosynthesis
MDVCVIIATANRAPDLRDTLTSLAEVRRPGQIELLVVDNRSTDDTRMVVADAARHFPFPLRYLYEGESGKYAALNAGIAASTGRVIVATDDDARTRSHDRPDDTRPRDHRARRAAKERAETGMARRAQRPARQSHRFSITATVFESSATASRGRWV